MFLELNGRTITINPLFYNMKKTTTEIACERKMAVGGKKKIFP